MDLGGWMLSEAVSISDRMIIFLERYLFYCNLSTLQCLLLKTRFEMQ